METVVQPPAAEELHLLTEWGDPAGRARTWLAAVLSLLANSAAVAFLFVLPEAIMQPPRLPHTDILVTPLIEPLTVFTQKEPNTSKPTKTFKATDLEARPRVPSPRPAAAPPRQAMVAPPPPKPAPTPTLPEPPKLEVVNAAPKLTLPVGPPQIQAEEKPRPAFENVSTPGQVPPDQRVIPIPGPSLSNAIEGALHSRGGTAGGIPQGLPGADELPQLLSDPQGVDFKPYLARVLAAVKSNWQTINQEAVKTGRQGRVSVQFAIQKDGTVRTARFAVTSGIMVMDNAANAAISMSNPFPPLPATFKGPEIHVQVNFAYNVPKHYPGPGRALSATTRDSSGLLLRVNSEAECVV